MVTDSIHVLCVQFEYGVKFQMTAGLLAESVFTGQDVILTRPELYYSPVPPCHTLAWYFYRCFFVS